MVREDNVGLAQQKTFGLQTANMIEPKKYRPLIAPRPCPRP